MDLRQEKGFTLIELLVVSVVTIIISTALISTFTGSLKNQSLNNIVALFDADLRRAQSLSNSVLQFQGSKVCGYGLHHLNPTSYLIYAIPRLLGTDCSRINHNYNSSRDLIYETITLKITNVALSSSFQDIFFEPPDLKVYIDDKSFPPHPATDSTRITFCFVNDPLTCRFLDIFLSGQINTI